MRTEGGYKLFCVPLSARAAAANQILGGEIADRVSGRGGAAAAGTTGGEEEGEEEADGDGDDDDADDEDDEDAPLAKRPGNPSPNSNPYPNPDPDPGPGPILNSAPAPTLRRLRRMRAWQRASSAKRVSTRPRPAR